MSDIKTRDVVKGTVKTLDRSAVAARHMKESFVRTKEKAEQSVSPREDSPEEYASDRMTCGGESAGGEAVRQAGRLGHGIVRMVRNHSAASKERTAQKKAATSKEPVQRQLAQNTRANPQGVARNSAKRGTVSGSAVNQSGAARTTASRGSTAQAVKQAGKVSIKTSQRSVKSAQQMSRAAAQATQATSRTAIKTTEASARAAKEAAKTSAAAARKAAQAAKAAARGVAETTKQTVRTAIVVVKAIAAGIKALTGAILAGGWVAVVIILIVVLFGCAIALFGGGGSSNSYASVSAQVEAYEPLIRQYASEHGIGEYVELVKAVMMQESGGAGSDPMQASECSYNTDYPNAPDGITDPEYSIDVGIQHLAACLTAAGVKNPVDMEHIKLALQGYNFGNGYITWALENDGGYSYASAVAFSVTKAEELGVDSYGDTQYVNHVLRYYPYGRAFTSGGSEAIVEVALTQVGSGGELYWSWYGFSERVEWCCCFVSWCADQCGYIDSGILPKFSSCVDGVSWFQANSQWQGGSYEPSAGDIIFFDWEGDGIVDHVGIVEKYEESIIYTVEGNSDDTCKQHQYAVGGSSIYGYGVPDY